MTDDLSDEAVSNVLQFPRRGAVAPKLDNSKSYAEQVTISCTATFSDIDNAVRRDDLNLRSQVRKVLAK